MKDISGKIEYKGVEYRLVFDLNVLEEIQDEYGSFGKWGDLVDGVDGETDIKAFKFGIHAALNEGIEIMNEENGTDIKPFTLRQVGRMLTEIGLEKMDEILHQTLADSMHCEEKNV